MDIESDNDDRWRERGVEYVAKGAHTVHLNVRGNMTGHMIDTTTL